MVVRTWVRNFILVSWVALCVLGAVAVFCAMHGCILTPDQQANCTVCKAMGWADPNLVAKLERQKRAWKDANFPVEFGDY